MTSAKKEMTTKVEAKGKDLEIVSNTTPVTTQFPSTISFTSTVKTVLAEIKKYSHLKRINTEDEEKFKIQYKELKVAIQIFLKLRTTNKKEEDTAKAPLNDYLKVMKKEGDSVRLEISTFETELKAELKRVDDIKLKKKNAQRKLWQDNLNTIPFACQNLQDKTPEELNVLLTFYNEYDFEALDFGDLHEQARSAVASAVNFTTSQINLLAEQEKVKKEREELRLKKIEDDKKESDRVEVEKAANKEQEDKDAATAKRIKDLEDQIAAAKPVDEVDQVDEEEFDNKLPCDDDEAADVETGRGRSGGGSSSFTGRSAAIESDPESTRGASNQDCGDANDSHLSDHYLQGRSAGLLAGWVSHIDEAIKIAPTDLIESHQKAVDSALDNLNKITRYLSSDGVVGS